MGGKIKDPKFRLVPMLVHVETWEKEAIERLGLNASQMVRDFLPFFHLLFLYFYIFYFILIQRKSSKKK